MQIIAALESMAKQQREDFVNIFYLYYPLTLQLEDNYDFHIPKVLLTCCFLIRYYINYNLK